MAVDLGLLYWACLRIADSIDLMLSTSDRDTLQSAAIDLHLFLSEVVEHAQGSLAPMEGLVDLLD